MVERHQIESVWIYTDQITFITIKLWRLLSDLPTSKRMSFAPKTLPLLLQEPNTEQNTSANTDAGEDAV